MEQPVQDGGSQGAVIVEDLGPFLEGTVGGNHDRALLVAQRDDLEEEISARLVNRQVAEFVEDEQGGFGVLLQFYFETPRILGRGQRVDDIDRTGKEHRVALEASGIAQRGRQMRFPQAHTAQYDEVGFGLDKLEVEVVLYLEAVN